MILGALEDAGGRAYLLEQARQNPSAFLALLGRLLPKPLPNEPIGRPIIQVITGVPHDGDPPTCTPAHTPAALREFMRPTR